MTKEKIKALDTFKKCCLIVSNDMFKKTKKVCIDSYKNALKEENKSKLEIAAYKLAIVCYVETIRN